MPRQAGFTLIESLIAILVFAIGVLGITALLSVSIRSQHHAYARAQAEFLSRALADRMRANPAAVIGGDYNGALPDPAEALPACPCNAATLAKRDLISIARQLAAGLPEGGGEVLCEGGPALSGGPVLAPFDGQCQIELRWRERSQAGLADAGERRFEWVFQP